MSITPIDKGADSELSGRDRMHISKNVKQFLVPAELGTEEERMQAAKIMGYIHRLLSKAKTVGDVVYYMPVRLLAYTGLKPNPDEVITTITFDVKDEFVDLIEERIVVNLLFSD